ncbi:MAG: primosomal protein N' [Dehalococcoidales bacterium]|nr:primosomal protein N' [Dehalococcoidales bacterium]
MGYAEVCVNAPTAQLRTFSYAIPSNLGVQSGQAVWVPFGQRLLQGIVIEITDIPAVENTKDIAGVIDQQALLSPEQITLARWISDYYLSSLWNALALTMPPGFERRVLTYLYPVKRAYDESALNETQFRILTRAQDDGRVSLKELEKSLGKKKAQANTLQLVKLGVLKRQYEIERARVKVKETPYVRLLATPVRVMEVLKEMTGGRAKRQVILLKYLAEQSAPIELTEIKKKTDCDRLTINALVKKGLAVIENVTVRREPLELQRVQLSQPLPLTAAQDTVFRPIRASLLQSEKSEPKIFLLHGVTGSGKTEIYLQALAETIKLGKRGIVLVPEIALTPQTIERFAARFPGRVAILHSHLSLGEQFDEWWRIKNGEVDVVIGPRSALFAPQPDLGIIIIDEEHEWTYKQHEQSPRYHTRHVALKMSKQIGCTVVMGSATPDIETYYHAVKGDFHLLRLLERVTPVENAPLPGVTIIDMRSELKDGNRSIFSRALTAAIDRVVENHEQAILFLNRRGMSTYIQCRNCGYVLKCRRCEVPLTYHLDTEALLCHQCNYHTNVPQVCPKCSSRRIRFLGIGTEKLEQEVKLAFPMARLLRWDRDVTRGRYSHQRILNKFRSHEADILVGTQMVAKGLDLPLVTLVGVINADLSLSLPDFRASERTFQLLSQVAGRAGRGPVEGHVIIQTYNPEHYAIQAAAEHNYALFYEQEINYRRQFHEPPFVQLANLTYTNTNDNRCMEESSKMVIRIKEERDRLGLAGIELIGPAPAYIHRLRGRYRWKLIIRGMELSPFLSRIPLPSGWTVDIDPIGL